MEFAIAVLKRYALGAFAMDDLASDHLQIDGVTFASGADPEWKVSKNCCHAAIEVQLERIQAYPSDMLDLKV